MPKQKLNKDSSETSAKPYQKPRAVAAGGKRKKKASGFKHHDPLHVEMLGPEADEDLEVEVEDVAPADNIADDAEENRASSKKNKKRALEAVKRAIRQHQALADEQSDEDVAAEAAPQQTQFAATSDVDDAWEDVDEDDAMDDGMGNGAELEEEVEEVVLDEEGALNDNDAALLDSFFAGQRASAPLDFSSLMQQPQQVQEQPRKIDLGAMILEKIREREAQQGATGMTRGEEDIRERMHPKVYIAYTKIGKMLKKYRSGPLPKAFRVIPKLSNWEEVLFLTKPEQWTPHAVYEGVKNFVAAMNEDMCQRFLNMVLFPRVMEDLQFNKKLNAQLYMALQKSLYKPGAFFKGIVLPMAEQGCTARQADAVCSVIKQKHIPLLHSAAALLKIAQMPYSQSTLLFVKCLVEKKYALPSKVIDAVVDYFYQFVNDQRELPLIWHKTLHSFVKIYKLKFAKEHKKSLFAVLKQHQHPLVTRQIRFEISARDSVVEQPDSKGEEEMADDE